jgi:hypothetical protein
MKRLYMIGCLNKTVASLGLYAAITLIFHRIRILRAYLVIPTRPVIRQETPHLLQMSWLCRNPEPDANDRALLKFTQGQSEAFSIRKDEEGCNTEVYIAGERYTQPLHLSSEHEWEQWLQQFEGESAGFPKEKGDKNSSVSSSTEISSAINLIMSGKSSSLSKMPFSEEIFRKIMSGLKLHKSIIRAINRNTSCTFSRTAHVLENKTSSTEAIGMPS